MSTFSKKHYYFIYFNNQVKINLPTDIIYNIVFLLILYLYDYKVTNLGYTRSGRGLTDKNIYGKNYSIIC